MDQLDACGRWERPGQASCCGVGVIGCWMHGDVGYGKPGEEPKAP